MPTLRLSRVFPITLGRDHELLAWSLPSLPRSICLGRSCPNDCSELASLPGSRLFAATICSTFQDFEVEIPSNDCTTAFTGNRDDHRFRVFCVYGQTESLSRKVYLDLGVSVLSLGLSADPLRSLVSAQAVRPTALGEAPITDETMY